MMRIWMRRIVICVATLMVLAGIGGLLGHSPFSADAISGATALSGTEKQLDGTYLLGVSQDPTRVPDDTAAEQIRRISIGRTQQMSPSDDLQSLTLIVREGETALVDYADVLTDALKPYGFNVTVKTYDSTMFRSRLYGGYYDLFLCPANYMDRDLIENATIVELASEEMKGISR